MRFFFGKNKKEKNTLKVGDIVYIKKSDDDISVEKIESIIVKNSKIDVIVERGYMEYNIFNVYLSYESLKKGIQDFEFDVTPYREMLEKKYFVVIDNSVLKRNPSYIKITKKEAIPYFNMYSRFKYFENEIDAVKYLENKIKNKGGFLDKLKTYMFKWR